MTARHDQHSAAIMAAKAFAVQGGRQTVAHPLSVLLPKQLIMIPALIAAVASMVVAIIAIIAM
jgi:hypothetical protein